MSYTLTGNCYIGWGSLPAPEVGYDAIDIDTGNKYSSNTSSTAWVLMGNVNEPNMGLLPLSGGAMTGAITGSTGCAPINTPDFVSSAKLDGLDLATINDLTDMRTTILDAVTPLINQAIASTTSSISVSSKIAFGHGTLTFPTGTPQTIPLPYYPGNIQATEEECVWLVAPKNLYVPTGLSSGGTDVIYLFTSNGVQSSPVDPTTTRTFCFGGIRQDRPWWQPCEVSYLIIGVRK